MDRSKAEFKTAMTSGDPDRVNAAIEEVKGPNTAERAHLFVSCIEEFPECYMSGCSTFSSQNWSSR
jgi:hypothetical protein